MSRDPALLAECRALQQAIAHHATREALRASPEWPALAPRFDALLHRVHRYEAAPAIRCRPAADEAV